LEASGLDDDAGGRRQSLRLVGWVSLFIAVVVVVLIVFDLRPS